MRALRSLRLTGKVLFGSEDSPIEAQYAQLMARPGLYREETTLQGLTAVDAWDGKEGWKLSPFGGRRDPFRASADDAKELAQSADLDGPLVDGKEKGNRIEVLGTEDVDGTEAVKLRVVRKDGDVVTYFLDEDTFLAIRELHQRMIRGSERIVEVDVGSYTDVAGVLVPFTLEAGRLGAPKTTRVTIERAEANVPVDETVFRFPPGGAKVARAIVAGPPAPEGPVHHATVAQNARPPVFDAGVLSGLGARNIGSAAMSGRVSAVAARVEDGKTTVYVGAASGGVWKSYDGGTTFKPLFDKQKVQSIGAIAIDPSDARTVWVGTGEAWTRNSVSVGDGIYHSTDGGETWTNMGLRESERVARSSSRIVYAVVESTESALYRSSDGGQTWEARDRSQSMVWGPFYFARLVIERKNPERLLKPNRRVIVSDDGGRSFTSAQGRAHGDWHDLSSDPE